MVAASRGLFFNCHSLSSSANWPCRFCRKTAMVKHQRRSHQGGLHGNETLDDCNSESDISELPDTPTQTAMS